MEELIEQLKRIADALSDGNALTLEWIETNKQWRKENVEKGERDAAAQQEWLEWQRQQKLEECEQAKQWQDANIEKLLAARKGQDELMLALQRELLTGEKNDDRAWTTCDCDQTRRRS